VQQGVSEVIGVIGGCMHAVRWERRLVELVLCVCLGLCVGVDAFAVHSSSKHLASHISSRRAMMMSRLALTRRLLCVRTSSNTRPRSYTHSMVLSAQAHMAPVAGDDDIDTTFLFGSDPVSFNALGLDPSIVSSLASVHKHTATQIQAKAFDSIHTRNADTLITAETGSGKTLAYLLPLVQRFLVDSSSAEEGTNMNNGDDRSNAQVVDDDVFGDNPHEERDRDRDREQEDNKAYPDGVIIVPNR
jgi:hypothetical protein